MKDESIQQVGGWTLANFPLFPEQASTFAYRVDPLFYILCIISAIATFGIFFFIVYAGAKFRKIEGVERPSHALHAPILEITWTVVPTIVFLGCFVWGVVLFQDYLNTPKDGLLEIDVVAKQWMWKLQHPNGVREVNELHVPVGRPVNLTMTSEDVLHDFYVPAFRVKQDVIPGKYTKLWFEPTKVGVYHLFCAEYCGTEHSLMIGKVHVMELADYAQWLAGGPKLSPVDAGMALFEMQGCVTCHTGQTGARCPDLKGVFGSEITLTDGSTVTATEDYILESILTPAKSIVQGFTPLMPANFSQTLSPEDINNIIAYIKSIGKAEPSAAQATPAPAPAAP